MNAAAAVTRTTAATAVIVRGLSNNLPALYDYGTMKTGVVLLFEARCARVFHELVEDRRLGQVNSRPGGHGIFLSVSCQYDYGKRRFNFINMRHF